MSVTLLTINAFDPLWRTSKTAAQGFQENISARMNSITMNKTAVGGSDTCQIILAGNTQYCEGWLQGIGRHIVIKDHNMQTIWFGYVNTISYNTGLYTVSLGPLQEVYNRVKVQYTPIVDHTADPVITGSQTETIFAEDVSSQEKYGIREAVFSGGTLPDSSTTNIPGTPITASLVRDQYLELYKDPKVSHRVASGQAVQPSLTLDCIGYWYLLDTFLYVFDPSSSDDSYVDDLGTEAIPFILDQDPNSILDQDYSSVDGNAYGYTMSDLNQPTALSKIQDILSLGGVSGNRWIAQVIPDKNNMPIFKYSAIPSTIPTKYQFRNGEVFETQSNRRLYPWQVDPAEWVYFADFLQSGGLINTSSVATDKAANPYRYSFLETVNYQSPYTGAWEGGQTHSAYQFLAQAGITG